MTKEPTKTVLIVDDDEDVRTATQKVLQNAGFEVEMVPDAEEALALIKRADFQVFLLDLEMPGMNGLQLGRQIRRLRPLVCIYAMTAHTSLYDVVQCRDAGFDDYFPKPFDSALLIEAVEAAFSKLERWRNIRRR